MRTPRPDRSLLALLAITLAAVAALLLGTAARDDGASPAQRTGDRIFPGLDRRLDAVTSLEVARASGRFVLRRNENGWSNLGVDGYPALAARVEETLAGLASLRYFAPKTRRARLHARLGVEDVSPEASSTRLTLKDANDGVLADIVVGRTKLNIAGLGREGTYVRHPGEQQAWLAEGRVEAAHDAVDWSRRSLVDIEPADVLELRLEHPDGEVIAFTRTPGAKRFSLQDLPEGASPRQPALLDYLAGILADLRFDDAVRHEPSSGRRFPQRVTVRTVHGLAITLAATAVDDDGRVWATISAGDATTLEGRSAAPALQERINSELAGWVFRLPRAVAERLSIRRAELVKAGP